MCVVQDNYWLGTVTGAYTAACFVFAGAAKSRSTRFRSKKRHELCATKEFLLIKNKINKHYRTIKHSHEIKMYVPA